MKLLPKQCAVLVTVAAVVIGAASNLFAADSVRPPNIVLFLVDDMGWMDSGAYGSKYYETPHIDRLATRGMRFTDAYAQPLCSPTRASLLTGKYSARHGITSATGHQPPQAANHAYLPTKAAANEPWLKPESKNFLEPAEYTLAEALRDAGYRTAHLGKWHLGLTPPYWPEQQGFDVAFHCHPDPGPPGNYFSPYAVKANGEPRGQNRIGTITDGPEGEYIVDRLAAEAEAFITANRDQPFFLNLWNYGVHGPWGHKENYTRSFADKQDPRGEQGNPIMASMLRSVDECLGRVVAALDKYGLTDNTIIVFNSDNGGNTHSNTGESPKDQKKSASPQMADWRKWAGTKPPTNNSPLRDGKGTLYEGGTRVPLIWSWPGKISAGGTNDAVVGHIDLYPTLLELIGVARPPQQIMDGISYAAELRQTGTLARTAFFNYFPHGGGPGRAGGVWVRSGSWKLIRWFGFPTESAERFELYDLKNDLSETTNLASDAAQRARVVELDALIGRFLLDTHATFPRPNPAYQPTTSKTVVQPAAADPLLGWKARQCDATVNEGVLTMTGKGKAGTEFLGRALGKSTGPATVKVRLRSPTGGSGKIEWLPNGTGDTAGAKSVAFTVPAGDWQTVDVKLATDGPLGVVRLYLPAHEKPIDIDWIEIASKSASPQRWDFGGK